MKALILFILPLMLSVQDKRITGEMHITAEDAAGRKNTIICGVHREASGDFDVQLGELPVPPVPTDDMFDFRFRDSPGKTKFASTGSYMDIRAYTSDVQIDTFVVQVRTESNQYPIRCTWPTNFSIICDSARLIVSPGKHTQTVDMLQQFEWVIEGPDIDTALIVRYGIRDDR